MKQKEQNMISKRQGFSTLEVLVVIAIVALVVVLVHH